MSIVSLTIYLFNIYGITDTTYKLKQKKQKRIVTGTYHCLHPMHCPSIDPDKVSRPLYEPVHWNILFKQILQNRPPWTLQKIHIGSGQEKKK